MDIVDHCSFPGCSKARRSRGLCVPHYHQWRRGSELHSLRTPAPSSLRAKLDAGTRKGEDCWEWVLGATGHGYGQIFFQGKRLRVHRVAYELAFGPIPGGMVIDHKCRNRRCVNPAHLHAVTIKENAENRGPTALSNTGVRGVWRAAGSDKWVARVAHNGDNYTAGLFATIGEAEQAAIMLRNQLFTNNITDRN